NSGASRCRRDRTDARRHRRRDRRQAAEPDRASPPPRAVGRPYRSAPLGGQRGAPPASIRANDPIGGKVALTMPLPLHEVCCARVAPDALAGLADLRCTSGIDVVQDDGGLWLRWLPGDEEVLLQLLPVAGATFFYQRDGKWYRLGSRLP